MTDAQGIPDGWLGLDVGPQSNERFAQVVSESKTILWNGWVKCMTLGHYYSDHSTDPLESLNSQNFQKDLRNSSRQRKKQFKRMRQ